MSRGLTLVRCMIYVHDDLQMDQTTRAVQRSENQSLKGPVLLNKVAFVCCGGILIAVMM